METQTCVNINCGYEAIRKFITFGKKHKQLKGYCKKFGNWIIALSLTSHFETRIIAIAIVENMKKKLEKMILFSL